jgi:hypothetical protein
MSVSKDGLVSARRARAARSTGPRLNAGVKAGKSSGGGFWSKMPKFGSKKSVKPIWSSPLMANNRLIMVGSAANWWR